MIHLKHRHHWWQAGLFIIALLLIIGSGTIAWADDTISEQPTSPSALTFLGTTLRSGFTTNLHDTNVASNKTITLSAQGALALQDYASLFPLSKKITYNWWVSDDQWHFRPQTDGHGSTFTYTAPPVDTKTTVKIQVSFTVINLFTHPTYWSNVASITIMPNRVPANKIAVNPDKQSLLNSDTTMVHAVLTPKEATDTVHWESSDSNLAAVDKLEMETVTVTSGKTNPNHQWDPHDHGKVKITGTIDQLSASTTLTIGMLQDQQVNEGDAVTFNLQGLPSNVTVKSWHRSKGTGQTYETLNTAPNQQYYTVPLTLFDQDNDTNYYATLSYIEMDAHNQQQKRTIDTNVAKLTVNNTHTMSLLTVPSFQFGNISLSTLKSPETAVIKSVDQRTTKQPALLISDLRQPNQNWQLLATLAPFTLISNATKPSINGSIQAELHNTSGSKQKIAINQKNAAIPLRGSRSIAYYLDNSQLLLQFNPQASPGQYHSTITWTLAAVP